MAKQTAEYKVEVFTGIRATGDLTVANYMGAVEPILGLQEKTRPLIFVADLHAMTDKEPEVAKKFINEVVADYIALGIDPNKTDIYIQSDIMEQVTVLMAILARHITTAELMRIPTLKEKLKPNTGSESANALLLLYPVMMAADILLQRAKNVPMGVDQLPHMEMTRELARRFNKKYGDVFPIPKALQVKSLNILSLRGHGKMSKSIPETAIFLTDDKKTVDHKIKKAETAFEGEINERLESHITLAKGLCREGSDKAKIDSIIKAHMDGKPVMGEFKRLFTEIVQDFLGTFQEKRAAVVKDPNYIPSILREGAKIAGANADETIILVKQALYGK